MITAEDCGSPAGRLRVRVRAADEAGRSRVLELARRAGIPVGSGFGPAFGSGSDPDAHTVLVATASTVDAAIDVCPPAAPSGDRRILIIADRFSVTGVRRAVRLGIQAMLESGEATPAQFASAVQAAYHGDGWLPHAMLLQLLGGAAGPAVRPAGPLTARQLAVLSLMAEGYGNAAIARELSCSEHTVRNLASELMARLNVRNRAQAVARGLREGLI